MKEMLQWSLMMLKAIFGFVLIPLGFFILFFWGMGEFLNYTGIVGG